MNSMARRSEDIYLFVNPKSGGNQGEVFLKVPQPFHHTVSDGRQAVLHIFSLLEGPSGNKPGFRQLAQATTTTPFPIRTIVGGGDGTVMWAESEAVKHGIDTARRLMYGIIPLGTGNDFSRVHGWGGKNPTHILDDDCAELRRMVELWMQSQPRRHDVWEVHMKVDDAHGEIMVVDSSKEEACLDETSKKAFMINYFSIGQESKVGIEFDKHRTKSQFCNLFVYACEGICQEMQCTRRQHIGEIVATLHAGLDDSAPIVLDCRGREAKKSSPKLQGNPESLMFLNVNSYAGGNAHFWSQDNDVAVKPAPRKEHVDVDEDPGDQRLEVVTLASIADIPLDQVEHHANAKRVYSGGPYYISFFQTDEEEGDLDAYCEVDGEFYHLLNPEYITVRLIKTLQVLHNQSPITESMTQQFLGHFKR